MVLKIVCTKLSCQTSWLLQQVDPIIRLAERVECTDSQCFRESGNWISFNVYYQNEPSYEKCLPVCVWSLLKMHLGEYLKTTRSIAHDRFADKGELIVLQKVHYSCLQKTSCCIGEWQYYLYDQSNFRDHRNVQQVLTMQYFRQYLLQTCHHGSKQFKFEKRCFVFSEGTSLTY